MKNVDDKRLKNKIIYLALCIALGLICFFFITWLYSPNEIIAFKYDYNTIKDLDKFSDSIHIQIINRALPYCELFYKNKGCDFKGVVPTAFYNSPYGIRLDLSDPFTYMNFTYAAFGQYGLVSGIGINNSQTPNIVNFEDAPEGAIYFSEEAEYKTKEAQIEGDKVPTQVEENTIENNVESPKKVELSKNDSQVLLYHSHATESYMPNTDSNYHTTNKNYNVIAVGDIITKVLHDKHKYGVIHEKVFHDIPSYAYSYKNSLETVKTTMTKHKSVKVLLDIHRDAFSVDKNTSKQKKEAYTAKINGKNAARIMLVVGKGNENYEELNKFAVCIMNKMEKLYPGLFLKIERSKNKYNQYLSDYAMLIEVGCMLNTVEEAKYSGELLGDVLGQVLKELEE